MGDVQHPKYLRRNIAGVHDAVVGKQGDVLAGVVDEERILQRLGEAALLVDARAVGSFNRKPDLRVDESVGSNRPSSRPPGRSFPESRDFMFMSFAPPGTTKAGRSIDERRPM